MRGPAVTESSFDVSTFIERSRSLDLSGIHWNKAKSSPLTPAELRILPYFIDVESYTIAYLKALLSTTAIHDTEIADFLPVWAYEEGFHGRALERFLREAGHPLDPARPKSVQRPRRFLEAVQDWTAAGVSRVVGEDFVAVHMTWGAIQEISTLNGYRQLAARTQNEVLAEIIRRIMKDESRHFSFYYHKAAERLKRSVFAQRLTAFLVNRFWKPVGAGIMPDGELDFLITYVFAGSSGRAEVRHVDQTIARLPGMAGFAGMETFLNKGLTRLALRP